MRIDSASKISKYANIDRDFPTTGIHRKKSKHYVRTQK